MDTCVSKLTIIGSDNGLSPDWDHAITWTNVGVLLIWSLVTNFSEILSEMYANATNENVFLCQNHTANLYWDCFNIARDEILLWSHMSNIKDMDI